MMMRLHVLATVAVIGLAQPAAAQFGDGFSTPLDGNYPVFVGARGLLVAQVKGTNTWASYSKHTGVWRTHPFASELKAIPIVADGCIAFDVTGGKTNELVAVDQQGRFRTHKLPEPSNKCIPAVSAGVAYFSIDKHVHAFSGLTGSWDSVESTSDPKQRAVDLSDGVVMLLERDRIVMFSEKTGRWAASPSLAAPAQPAAVGAN